MPQVHPLRGIGYGLLRPTSSGIPERIRIEGEPSIHPRRVADLTDVVAPPFDVITPGQRRDLLARDARNVVRLELSAEDDPHAAAASTLAAWLEDGTLERRRDPTLYRYSYARPAAPDAPAVHGVLARVLLEPFGAGVRAHEKTMAAPKADRLGLLTATHTQLSAILAVYLDRSTARREIVDRPVTDEWRARDSDGLLHTLAAITPDEELIGYLSRQQLFIADGHHRYETALAYQACVRTDPRFSKAPQGSLPVDWVMMVLINAEHEQLEIRATHRLVREVDPAALHDLVSVPSALFQALPMAPEQLEERLRGLQGSEEPAFGVVLADGLGYLLIGDAEGIADRMRRTSLSRVVQNLDVSVLHTALLGDGLDLWPEEAGRRILYTTDPADALARVRSGEVQAAFLVRPTRLDQLALVANAGDVMPEKSTYFYPKLLTGMVFYSLEDE